MRVLVTGHEGYIGAVMVPALQARGHEVVGCDIGLFAGCDLGPPPAAIPMRALDVRDITPEALEELGPLDAVVHLAALSNDPLGEIDPTLTHAINHEGTVALARAARRRGVPRFLFASSCSLYGAGEGLLTEAAPMGPLTAYARSKVESDAALTALADASFSPVFLRNATAYGVSPRLRLDVVLNNLVGWATTTGRVRLLSDGLAWRPLVHVDDICAAFAAALEAPRDQVHAEAFNVGVSGENFRIRELAELVREVVPGCEVEYAPGGATDHRDYRVDFDKARRSLPGFAPRWTARLGAEQLQRAYREHHLSPAELHGGPLVRLAWLRSRLQAGVLGQDLRWRSGAAPPTEPAFTCRSCSHPACDPMLDLGTLPLANRLLDAEALPQPEPRYPLATVSCPRCTLVQITQTVAPEALFRDYVYFSSVSDALVEHARALVEHTIAARALDERSWVVEIASNDGYLLQHYQRAGIPVQGIDPARNVAEVARRERGIPTIDEFFDRGLAERLRAQGRRASVIHAHNVLAHVADLHGVVAGVEHLLADDGIAIFEVPYLRSLIDHVEFDTIYHEHLCYFSLTALVAVFGRHALVVDDVERLEIHGGSLRLRVSRAGPDPCHRAAPAVHELLREEASWGVARPERYLGFAGRVQALRTELVELIDDLRDQGHRIAAYGASAKGTTLLNAFGIGRERLEFVVDRSVVKQGRYTPGTHLPIHAPEHLLEQMPAYTLLLTWNFAEEIIEQQHEYRRRGGRFIIPVPTPTIR